MQDEDETIQNKYLKCLKTLIGVNERINYQEAFNLITEIYNTVKKANPEILIILGIMNEKGLHIPRSYKNAIKYYKEAAKLKSGKAYFHLGQLAENKILDEEDGKLPYDDVAFDYYKKSAEKNYSDAFAKLGVIFENGYLNTKIDLKQAFDFYKQSVDIDNNPIGLNGLGNAYYNGKVVEQNFEQAVEYYKRAIYDGNIDALNNLGICYEYGKGVEQNDEQALKYYNRAKEKNHPNATANYGILKIRIGIKNHNHTCFSECYRILQSGLLLDKNNPEIYYYIGFLYEIGFDMMDDGNIIKNQYLAFLNFKKAGELGYAKGYTKIGISYYNGIEDVFNSNKEKCIALLEKAFQKGDDEAKKYLDFLKNDKK